MVEQIKELFDKYCIVNNGLTLFGSLLVVFTAISLAHYIIKKGLEE